MQAFTTEGDELVTKDGDDPTEQVSRAVEELSTTVDERLKAVEAKTGEVEAKADTSKLAERLDKLEARANRPGGSNAQPEGDQAAAERKALNTFLRSGRGALDADDKKALNLGTDSAGGYVSAPEYSTRIIDKITELSPMRSVASVTSIGTTQILIPRLASKLTGTWVTETGTRQPSEPAFEQVQIDTHEHAVIVPMSNQLVEDSFVDLQAYVSGQIGSQFGVAEAEAFVAGDGSGKPEGFLNDPSLFTQVEAAQDASNIAEKLIALFYSLPTQYAMRGAWMMNRGTMAIIRNALDTTDKGTLWSDSLADGTPAQLLGRPVREAVDMPDFAPTPAADTFPVAFGDFRGGYQIVDRIGVQLMRDDFTGADSGVVKLRARRRVGGKTVQPDAIALMKSVSA